MDLLSFILNLGLRDRKIQDVSICPRCTFGEDLWNRGFVLEEGLARHVVAFLLCTFFYELWVDIFNVLFS